METIETYKGINIDVSPDEYPMSPREWDNLGTMVCWANQYILGDEQPTETPLDYFADLILPNWQEQENVTLDHVFSYAEKKGWVILPLYLYDHGGISMSTSGFSCSWDSGQVGYIYISPDKIKHEQIDADRVEQCLINEVKTYDDYLTGAVYFYNLDGDYKDTTIDDSCSGFYGYDHEKSGLLEQARSFIDSEIKYIDRQEQEETDRLEEESYQLNNLALIACAV